MTLKRHFPAGIRYFAATYEPEHIRRSGWWRSDEGIQRVMKEQDRIVRYLKAGNIGAIQEDPDDGAFV